jgi:anti-sigma B factor antagonist
MEINSRMEEDVAVVTVAGSIDALTSEPVLNAFLAEIQKGATRLVADLSGVVYTSSAGLRSLLAAQKEIRLRGGDFRLAGVQPPVMKLLKLSGFTNIIKMYEDTPTAVASFGS